jgi:hypothetical protein
MHFLTREVEKFIKKGLTTDEAMSNLGSMYHGAITQILNENTTDKNKIIRIETMTVELDKAKHRWTYR